MVGFAVVVGIAVTSRNVHDLFTLTSALGFLTGFFVSSFSMVSNDIYDYEIDNVNQPDRPLPSGVVTRRQAVYFSVVLLVLGLLCSIALGVANFAIAAVFALIGWYYNYGGKKLGLAGNSMVALSLAIPYIFGSVALHDYTLNLGYLLALTSFLAGMGREVLKGISDVEGDRLKKAKTVAIQYGVSTAKYLTASFFLMAVVSSLLPIWDSSLLGRALPVYAGLVSIPDAIFLYLSYRVISMKVDKDTRKLKTVALGGMLLGLIAYLVSGLLA